MKKLLSLSIMAILVLSVMPVVFAAGTGSSVGGSIGVEEFEPMVYQCGNRVLIDDDVQPWRITNIGETMVERNQQYLFDGERYQVDVLVFDKNKIQDDMVDLVLEGEEKCTSTCGVNNTCHTTCENPDDKMINCVPAEINFEACNARIGEEELDGFDPRTMQGYTCTIDVLDSEHMYGLYWLSVRAVSGLTDAEGAYDEIARWFINPVISLSVDGNVDFSDVRPGTSSYSTVLLENTAEGGVLLDMFITGNNWPAADAEMGRCQLVDSQGKDHDGDYVNYLPLGAFRYYAENGAFSTRDDLEDDNADYDALIVRDVDNEGYVNIHRQLNAGFEESMFDEAEIIQANAIAINGIKSSNVYLANILYPGSAGMTLTMRLNLPEPCYGSYESGADGSIFFWGEAI